MNLFCRIFIISVCVFFTGKNVFADKDMLTQISTIGALVNGVYDGDTSLGELTGYGDLGIGTFQALDGEMILIDGVFYRIGSDGVAAKPDVKTKTPFAAVTFFESDFQKELPAGTVYSSVEKDGFLNLPSKNVFYAVKIEGIFQSVRVRSVPRQEKPYAKLTDIVKNQPEFTFENTEGVMVGFICPVYVKGVNVPGYHLHFITKDRKRGGHVLDFTAGNAVMKIDETRSFSMYLPNNESFDNTDLSSENEKAVNSVEKK